MLRHLALGFTALFAMMLVGCALSPQQLNPHLDINSNLTAVGQGQPVLVRIEDARASQVVGSRGGVYSDSSNLLLRSQDIRAKLQVQAEKAVRLLGFTPTTSAGRAPRLTVVLSDLKYQVPKGTGVVTDVDVAGTLRAEVQSVQGRRYSGRYSASLHQSFAAAPSEKSNADMVSSVLSDALNRLFRDPAVADILRSR